MATGQTSPTINDWQTVQPDDWQTVGPNAPHPDVFHPQPPQNIPGLPPGMGAPAAPPNPIQPVGPNIPDLQADPQNAGLMQMGRGAKEIAHAPNWERRAQGASDIIRGAGYSGIGAAAAMAPLSPIGTAAGLVGGAAGGFAAQKTAEALGAPEGYANLAGDVGGIVGGGLAAKRPGVRVAPLQGGEQTVDPHVAALRAWGFQKDPYVLDQIANGDIKLTSGLADLKPHFQAQHSTADPQGYANESVLKALPSAKKANRDAWQMWMDRAQGERASGAPIIRATTSALKDTINDQRAQAILDDAVRVYGHDLTPSELESLLNEKNGELKSFYSQSPEVQAAAERAGADTLRTKALLEAQAKAIRQSLYNLLDPEGQGAGPRELQQRYGALKTIEEGANARRTAIQAEHPVNPYETVANFHLDPRAIAKQKMGSSEWLIENALNSAPPPNPLPMPEGLYPRNYTPSARQIPAHPRPVPTPQPSAAPYEMDIRRQLPQPSLPNGPSMAVQRYQPRPTPPATPTPTGDSIATRLGKQVWRSLGGPPVE